MSHSRPAPRDQARRPPAHRQARRATACAFRHRVMRTIRSLRCIPARLVAKLLAKGRRRDPAQPHLAGRHRPSQFIFLAGRPPRHPRSRSTPSRNARTIRRHGGAHLAAAAAINSSTAVMRSAGFSFAALAGQTSSKNFANFSSVVMPCLVDEAACVSGRALIGNRAASRRRGSFSTESSASRYLMSALTW